MNVFIVVAMTADGFIGQGAHHLATEWTNKDDKELFVRFVKPANNMVMGRNTFFTTAKKYPTVFTKTMPGRRFFVYTDDPAEVASYPEIEATAEAPEALIKRLESEGVKDLAICGGTQIYSMFLAAGVVDDIYVDIQATLFGKGQPFLNLPLETKVSLQETDRLGPNNLLLHYRVEK